MPPPQDSKSALNLAAIKVLIVEDAEFIRFLLATMLRSFGIRNIDTAANGTLAIKLITEKSRPLAGTDAPSPYHLIITDLLMDEVNGFMLLRWLRTSPNSPDPFVPVVVLSSASELKNIERSRDLGANCFMSKPFSPDLLWQKLMGIFYKPRRFILGSGYFGPERRNLHVIYANDRRAPSIELTLMRRKVKMIDFASTQIVHFELPNMLAALLGQYPIEGDLPKLDSAVASEIKDSVNAAQGDYKLWFVESISTLEKEANALLVIGNNDRGSLFQILKTAENLYSEAKLYNFDLASEIARSFAHTMTELTGDPQPKHVTIIKAYIESLKAAFSRKLKNDGDQKTIELLEKLREVAKRT